MYEPQDSAIYRQSSSMWQHISKLSHDKDSSVSTKKLINYKECIMAILTLKKKMFAVQQNPSLDNQSTLKSPFLLEK